MKKREEKLYGDGKVIFREGDQADCMYRVAYGLVDIYINYKTSGQKLLATMQPDDYFGEMALIEDTVRSATAVSRSGDTKLIVYPKKELDLMLKEETPMFMDLLAQMSSNLIRLTDKYADVCRTIAEYRECEEEGKAMDGQLSESIQKYAGMADQ